MDFLAAVAVTLLGLLVGGFLTTLIARVPGAEPLLDPGPTCRTCAAPIQRRDRIPVLSWLVLRGRCRTCGTAIPARYLVVEAGTGLLFLLTYLWVGASWELPAALYLASLGVVCSAIDLEHKRLPNLLTWPSYPIMLGLLALATLGEGSLVDLGRALAGGAAVFGVYLVLHLIYPKGMGYGDVKLSGVLGMVLGWAGWSAVLVGWYAGFLIGAIAGIAMILLRRIGLKGIVPFGPSMILGTYVGLLYGERIGQWFLT